MMSNTITLFFVFAFKRHAGFASHGLGRAVALAGSGDPEGVTTPDLGAL